MIDLPQDRARLELHILASLARSQRALARMIEAVADQVADSKQAAGKMIENLEMISAYQRILVVRITSANVKERQTRSAMAGWKLIPTSSAARHAPIPRRSHKVEGYRQAQPYLP
ncbi:hypothetical protein [Paenibacillus sp. GP183]|uniref:hypothetical protein n=1 Tax=Paenibacillus sp. GP183 TaxID=1882751 RepID=UPI00089468B8|nr:hypothetical protein [Paenibacillus sp. GP183]SEC70718.1 hypothetical protein SAMN05443246_5076 [Paenibacillus sp. GP183]